MKYKLYILSFLNLVFFTPQIYSQNIQINNITPSINQNNVNLNSNIIIEFDQNITAASLNEGTFIVRGSQSGKLSGVFSGTGGQTITFNPDNDFRLGEIISFTITTALMSDSGFTLSRGHTYSFTAVSGPPPSNPITFAQRNLAGASPGGRDIKALDYDNDGDLDILTSNEGLPEQIIVFENDGNMNFCSFSTGGNFRYIEVYDIDGDGDYDNFGATGAFDTELNWFENEGTTPYTERFISSDDPWTLTGGDLDSDGDIDVVAAVLRISPVSHHLLWFPNDGNGNFSPALEIPSTFGGGSESFFYIRDINSDGAMDILAFHRDDYNLVWYENNGSQSFTEHFIQNSADRSRLASGDLDGDGDIDIVKVSVENGPTAPISWFENDGMENFTEHIISSSSTGRIYVAAITDLDGDMDMDILAGGYWFENNGSQIFNEKIFSEGLGTGNNYFSNGINYADIDDDGDMDILTQGLHTTSWQENSRFMNITTTTPPNAENSFILDGNINITFDQPINISTVNGSTIRVYSQTSGLISGNFSGGGTNTITFDPANNFLPGDIIEVSINERVLSISGHSLSFAYGFSFQIKTFSSSQPNFLTHPIYIHSNNSSGLDVADMDADGDPDLVSSSWSDLLWHENDGSGNFTSHPITITDTPVGVFAIDHNEDGHMDIRVDNDGFASNTLYTNDGSQNFTESTVSGSLRLKQLTDVNHDGDMDLVSLNSTNDWISWLDFQCDGYVGFGAIPHIASKDVQAADMDNDGDNDFITASSLGPEFYMNNGFFNYSNSSIDNNNTINVYLSDLDGDNDLDPLFVENFSAIIWYENRLNEVTQDFGPRLEIAPLTMDPRDVIAVDIDGDGDNDAAAISRNDDKVVWYENRLNEATADFGPEQLGVTTADGPIKILAADLDADGDMDLITISDRDDELIWFENTGSTVDIPKDEIEAPLVFGLQQNFPNPFNPATTIKYSIAQTTHVTISVFNPLGQMVGVITNSVKSPGNYTVNFNAENLSSGIYYYTILTENFVDTKKMLLIK
ncbi:MAG: T9SS type A sorting domain-containing protein [Ignavibacteriae bacterium]|nr:T9SS type A sorting domain-containing protein [Ignavibacteriota bacterium]